MYDSKSKMGNLRSTVIMKTDLAGFTDRVVKSSHRDLSELLGKHDKIISDVVERHAGTIIKGEGDSFWVTFPSVSTASLAAKEIQRDLQHAQVGSSDEDRLAIRIAITVGDVLHQEGDIFGDSVNLTARIESITPPGEIYLSHAASLTVNKAEVSLDYLNEFDLKGFSQRERIYRINHEDEIRLFENRVMLNSALKDYHEFTEEKPDEDIEKLIIENDDIAKHICYSYGGTILQTVFGSYKIIFEDIGEALKGARKWATMWEGFLKENNWQNHLGIGMHLGDFSAFRSHVFGRDLDKAIHLRMLIGNLYPECHRNRVLVTAEIFREIEKNNWALHFREFNPFELESVGRNSREKRNELLLRIGFEEGEKAYELVLSDQ